MKTLATAIGLAVALSSCATAERRAPAPVADAASKPAARDEDPYLWLEATDDAKALDWVKARNAETVEAYARTPAFDTMQREILEVLDSDAKIPYVTRQGEFYYNFWRDKAHPRGVWRRTTLAEYRKDHPAWETVLDLDALGQAEHENWVWEGADCLRPAYRRCMIALSRGGADATVVGTVERIRWSSGSRERSGTPT